MNESQNQAAKFKAALDNRAEELKASGYNPVETPRAYDYASGIEAAFNTDRPGRSVSVDYDDSQAKLNPGYYGVPETDESDAEDFELTDAPEVQIFQGTGLEGLLALLGNVLSQADDFGQDGERCCTRDASEDEPYFTTNDVRAMFYALNIATGYIMEQHLSDPERRSVYRDHVQETISAMTQQFEGDPVTIAEALVDTIRKVDDLGHDMVIHGIGGVFLPPM